MLPHRRAVDQTRARFAGVRAWTLWSIPKPARAFLLATELAAAGCTAGLLLAEPLTGTIATRGGILLALAIGYTELARRSERIRRYLSDSALRPNTNPMSVWSFAAVLTLPAGWAAAFVAAYYAHIQVHRALDHTGSPYRTAFTAAAAMLAQLAAAAMLTQRPGNSMLHGGAAAGLVALAAAAVFTAVDLAVLLAGMWLTLRPPSIRAMVPDADSAGYELATLVLGIGVATMLVQTPAIVAAMLVPVGYLHRSSMVKALHQSSRQDSKTGLLNMPAWTDRAGGVLARCQRAGRAAAVLIIDVDHFKAVNDSRGHLVGDRVLLEVAHVLQRELRGHDCVGRFGGDEFVVLLDELAATEAEQAAGRLRDAIRAIRVDDLAPSVSMGLAHSSRYGTNLTALLTAADHALYQAKAAGRDQLRVAAVQ